ncbi:MAG: EH signature domain-containing protein [Flavobacteriaceae bacterium]
MKINAKFILPEWKEDLLIWENLKDKVTDTLLQIYNGSHSFAKYHNIFRKNPTKKDLQNFIKQDVDSILPFAFIANADSRFYKNYFDNELVDLIFEKSDQLSERTYKLIMTTVINNLNDDDQQISNNSKRIVFAKYNEENNKDQNKLNLLGFFNNKPINKFASYCQKIDLDPKTILLNNNLHLPINSKFLKMTKIEILLNKLRTLNFKENNNLSRTIIQQNLYNSEYKSLDLVGHEIIRIILMSNASVDIHKSWIQLILSIASDPRSSDQSRQYQKWWLPIDKVLIDRFVRILSHSEILLFLEAISEFATSENSEMSRMFESRKQLLIGLSIQNKIEKSRLYLPAKVLKFLKQENPKLDLSYVCNLQGERNKCIIYLKIGDNHIIEGSHNCKIRLYSQFNSQNMLLNPRLKELSYSKITTGLEDMYWANNKRPLSLVHHANGKWKMKIIEVLSKNIDFKVDQLLTDQEINYYRY